MITINFTNGSPACLLMGLALIVVVGYAFVLRVDTSALANLSNWCLSHKARLEAGRAAFNAIRVKPRSNSTKISDVASMEALASTGMVERR